MKGSGVDEWPCIKFVWAFKYILVHVYIGVPIKLFFVRKPGGGGESKQILREYGFKKTSKITDDPLRFSNLETCDFRSGSVAGFSFEIFLCPTRSALPLPAYQITPREDKESQNTTLTSVVRHDWRNTDERCRLADVTATKT